MVVLVGLVEAFVAGRGAQFSRIEPDDWREAAEVAARDLPSGGVLILGDSQAKFGISPLQVEATVGQPAQCLAIQGGQAPSSYFLLRKALDAGMIPSAVVVDFEPHLLRDRPLGKPRMWAELLDLGECSELAATANNPGEFAAMALGRVLPSYRERLEIRANLMDAFRGATPSNAPLIAMARRNRGMNRGAVLMSKDLGDHKHDIATWGNPTATPWEPNPTNDRYARRLLRLAEEHNIPVYATLLPLAPGVQAKYEKSGIDGRQVAWLKRLQDRYSNFRVLDFRHADYAATAFFDALHLNATGAAAVGAALGDHLARVNRGEIAADRWTTMPRYAPPALVVAVEDSSASDAILRTSAARRR